LVRVDQAIKSTVIRSETLAKVTVETNDSLMLNDPRQRWDRLAPTGTDIRTALLAGGHKQSQIVATRRRKEMPKKGLAVFVFILCLSSILMWAQTSQPASQTAPSSGASNGVSDRDIELLRSDLRSQRKQVTAQYMPLTADEATKFWPIFDQYRQEAIKPNDDRWNLIKEYAANYNTMTDAQAQDYIKRSTAIDQQLLDLRTRYVPMFEKVISPKKTALWFQIDRRVDLLINMQLSSQIPMVDASK
jgi:hypothetical protein